MKKTLTGVVLAVALAAPLAVIRAQQPAAAGLDEVLNALTFRNIGPFRTSAWITDIAVPETPARDHLYTIYAASRSGGLWKTTNNGVTWDVISDSVEVAAVGAVAVAPSNANVVWMGTGDQANARSSYSGKGVFKSTDAGKTWQPMGLPDSHHIARIVIHPKNPDVVYVAAMGHLFSRNDERGVFRTQDGGKTWQKVLFVNDGVGAIDLVMSRRNPMTLYAAMYEKHRSPWQLVLGGPGTGLYRSDDGGTKWHRVEGGLPTGTLGRIGLDINFRNPNILYALVENVNTRPEGVPGAIDACNAAQPGRGAGAAAGARGAGGAAADQAGRGAAGAAGAAAAPAAQPGRGRGGAARVGNEVFRSDDGGKTWRKTHGDDIDVGGGKAPYSFNQIRMDPNNPDRVIINSDQMYVSEDGGKTWSCSNTNGFFRGVFGDYRTMWWDPEDSNRILIGSDGGLNVSYDGGRTADYFLNMRIGEMYAIGVDMDDPYNVYGGMQDHDSWKGPSNGLSGRITLEHWTTVGPGDGMYNQVDPTNSRWVYNTREMGNHGRFDQLTGQRTVIAPPPPQGRSRGRYVWAAPIVLSPHNPQIVYAGADVLFRSLNRGDGWEQISDDLTTNETGKCGQNSGSVPYCAITTISESPLRPGVIWIGTDDGKVQLTQNHGAAWTDLTPSLVGSGALVDRYVSRVFASPHDAATAFVAKSGFRHDDFTPYLYRTTDLGKTWTSIGAGLPASPINVVVQDRKNANLLIVGNDMGVWVSIDAGRSWARLKANLPAVAVHDLTVHPREGDLVLGTYGRAIWVGDITPLQELTAEIMAKTVHLFDIEPRARYGFSAIGNYNLYGDKYIEIPNEPEALIVNYYLRSDATGNARVTVTDATGRAVRTVDGPGRRGLNRAVINLAAGGGGRGGPPAAGGGGLATGDYVISLEVAGEKLTKPGRVRDRIR
ncbi:MAG TPA: hypothetical protein VES67_22585 [Vicinamibacterales bacterium]|nr:hypothetical protein [Vicinamibacterales bacterium]